MSASRLSASVAATAPTPPLPDDTLGQLQRHRARSAGAAAFIYAAGFGAATALWALRLGAGVPLNLALCALPALWLAALGVWPVRDARQTVLRLLVALMFAPLLLLFWVASLDPATPPAARGAAATLDLERVSAGAQAVQSAGGGAVPLMRSALFADGTELRLTRLSDPEAAARYLSFTGEALQGRPHSLGERTGLRFNAPGGLVIHAERHGADVLEVRARDEAGALARLAAQGVGAPSPTLAAPAPAQAIGPAFAVVGAALLHLLALLAFVAAMGRYITQVPPGHGAPALAASALRERLLSVQEAGLPCSVFSPGAHLVEVELPAGSKRSHRVMLRLDAARQRVLVTQRLGTGGDAPLDEEDARLQAPGGDGFDASRAPARNAWRLVCQTTLVSPQRLAALAPRFDAGGRLVASRRWAGLDGEDAITLLCALVTASGWHWQPRWWLRSSA